MHSHNRPYRTLMENLMKFYVLCLKPLSLSHSQRERERERRTHKLSQTLNHTCTLSYGACDRAPMTLDFPNSAAQLSLYQEQCSFNTQVHTCTLIHTLQHTCSPSSAKINTFTHLLTIQQWERQEGREMRRALERWRGCRHRMRDGRNQLVQPCVNQLEPRLSLPTLSSSIWLSPVIFYI